MKFKYNITPRDMVYLNYNIVGDKHLKRLNANLIMTPVLLIGVIILFQFRGGLRPSPIFLIAALIGLMIWIRYSRTVLDAISIRRLNKVFKNPDNTWLLNERTMTITEDRVVETIDHLDGLEEKVLLDMPYEDMFTVDKSNEGVYIFVNDRSAFIIPRRAFNSDEEMLETFNYIEEKIAISNSRKEEILIANESNKTIIEEENINQEETF